MTKLENYLQEVKARNQDCVCDARYSGVDESLYSSRGCPSCECHHLADVEVLLEMVAKVSMELEAAFLELDDDYGFKAVTEELETILAKHQNLEALVPEEER